MGVSTVSIDHVDLYNQHAAEEARAAQLLFAPSRDEVSILSAREPGITFRPVHDVAITPGRQSRVSVMEYRRRGETFRIVWKRMGADRRLDLAEAKAMRKRLSPYWHSLEAHGWRIPILFYSTVEELNGEFEIFTYEQFIDGGDAEHMISDPEQPIFRKWYVIEEVLRLLYSYPEGPGELHREEVSGKLLTVLPHGLDLKLANLILEPRENQLYFVDLFAPKELTPDGTWESYTPKLDSLSAENLKAVTATREGAILRFWRLARTSWEPVRTLRPLLQEDFLERLRACEPPEDELRTIRDEMDSNFAWLDRLYSEPNV